MHIRLIIFFSLFFSINSFATTTLDSIGTESNNGKKVILHKIESKETYYSLGRKYNVSPKDIISFNNNLALHIGTVVKVPTDKPFTAATASNVPKKAATTEAETFDFKVGPKETLFSIAKRFNTTVDEIKQLNNLKSNSLSVGQILKVRHGVLSQQRPEPVVESPKLAIVKVPTTNAPTSSETDSGNTSATTHVKSNRYGLREMSERGVAVWIADENLDGTKMLVLHRSAPVGTVIKITNPMTERSTFAKVVGRFTENETTKDVMIVVTKATADLLGALDKRFQVSIVYGVPNE